MFAQRTVNKEVVAHGIGLHSGQQVTLRLLPAPSDTGIVFKRTDTAQEVCFQCQPGLVQDTRLSTTLVVNEERIGTVEHLMSALAGLGIDNVIVELNGAEIPVMDGSAAPFVFLLQSAGLRGLDKPKKFLRIKKRVSVEDGNRSVALEPYDGFNIDFVVNFNHPVFPKDGQRFAVEFSTASYINSICRARTFGFLADYEKLKQLGLARGGALSNAIVLDAAHIVNKEGLRTQNEFVKHKILDAIGDLYVCGHALLAKYAGDKAGHELNNRLIRKVLDDQNNFEFITFEEHDVPIQFSGTAF